ncbi:MAG: protein kinase [Olsenella sp.]|jgi:serine/threonine protein kinase|nr:protein kinase [Olsenella sp.]
MSENLDVKIPWPGWRVVSRLGHGTYGSVWEIERDVAGDSERCALKVIGVPPEGEADDSLGLGYDEGTLSATYDERADAVLREYRLMAGLSSHPNVVSCRDFAKVARVGEPGYDVLIRMELLTPLTRWVRGKEIAVRDAARIGRDVARALSACESRGIVHRDVKPENIMVDEWGNFKLGDFGVARTLEGTRTATVAGTQSFMAPEVIRHDHYNQTVDIYSLGLVMWWLLDNYRLPFMPAGRLASGDVARAEARRLAGESVPTPAGCPNAFARIVLRACAFRPEDRYQSAAEMVADLEEFLAGDVSSGATVTPRAEVDVAVQQSDPVAGALNDTDWGETTDATVGKGFGGNSARHANSYHDEPATVGRTPTSGQSPHATVTPTTRRIPKPAEGPTAKPSVPPSKPANGPTAKPSVPPALDDAALRAFFADLFDESAERKKTKDDAAFGAFFPLADLLGEPAERKKTKAESFCAGLSTVCGFLWIMLIVLIIVIFISEPGDMISSFQNGQPPDYIVLFSLLFSPVVCAGLMYKAERNKQYFKEDFLGTFLRGAVCASCLFALVLVYGLISMAMHTLR